jgi:conjugal transfer pilus assembly protein TraK
MIRSLSRRLFMAAIVLCAAPRRAAEDPGIERPPVPRGVLLAARADDGAGEVAQRAATTARSEAAAPPPALELGPRIVRVSPGTTVIVEVAIDHLNRIVTPFATPKVRTVSAATTQVDGSVIYVATTSEEPVTLYITEGDDPTTAIALTLAPRHIPPREVRLVPAASGSDRTAAPLIIRPAAKPSPAARAEAYVEDIAAAFRDLAQERLPAGFGLRPAGPGEQVTCTQPGLRLTTAQVLDGTALRLLVARATNRGPHAVTLDERRCATTGGEVAAVAAWPRLTLDPDQASEVYVAVRVNAPERVRQDRPSLLGAKP